VSAGGGSSRRGGRGIVLVDYFIAVAVFSASLATFLGLSSLKLKALGEAERRFRAVQAAESALAETRSAVLLAARHALSEAQEANQAVAVAEQNQRYHQEKYRVTSSAFAESLATFDDLLDDHVELAEAELALYQAQYQARLKEAEARRLIGAP